MKKKVFSLLLCAILMAGCTSDNDFENGKRQLEAQGYTNIKNTGYEFLCCGKEDTFSTGFTAVDKNGNAVEGCFCGDFLKGMTIRYE